MLYADIELNIVDGSSVWLSSMASVLCGEGICILVSRSAVHSDIVLANVADRQNLIVLEPAALGLRDDVLTVEAGIGIVRALDALLPDVRRVVVRGLEAAHLLLGTRQFRERSVVYLTDFYSHTPEGVVSSDEQSKMVAVCAVQAGRVLVQTERIEERLRQIANSDFRTLRFPPVVPDTVAARQPSPVPSSALSIGYAGKIAPNWGIEELLDLVETIRAEGGAIDLEIVANKVSRGAGAATARRMEAMGVTRHTDYDRARSMALMATVDFVWCWRPASFEEETLELSTKLVEGVASGWRCICYPSRTNRALLGDDYPFFAQTIEEARGLLAQPARELPEGLAARVHDCHRLSTVAARFRSDVLSGERAAKPLRIVFAGHDYKFIDPYISSLKARGHAVLRDRWRWGDPADMERTRSLREGADIVFCEWGLANSEWHSANLLPGQRLFVRMHLQEVDQRARRFGASIDIAKVERVVFVQEEVRQEALRLWGWPEEKTVVVPNFVLEDEYRAPVEDARSGLVLGMVGIVPQRKRFDRALDLLEKLRADGHAARLMIKGPRPETLDFMRAPGRAAELQYYRDLYRRIEESLLLAGHVSFEGWGNDVALWYRQVDHILSPSDFESFHYALADGVLSGCQPVVWPWKGAGSLYRDDWVVEDLDAAAGRIVEWAALDPEERRARRRDNRETVVSKYGSKTIFSRLDDILGVQP